MSSDLHISFFQIFHLAELLLRILLFYICHIITPFAHQLALTLDHQ